MKNSTIKALVNNKTIATTLRAIPANYGLEQKMA